MLKIGLLSDTHSFLHPSVEAFLSDCDQIWHAGDIGTVSIMNKLSSIAPLIAVYGNIDGNEIRQSAPLSASFYCEELKVLMIHIGGYPGRYAPGVLQMINREKPGLFVAGHSHILRVINDKANQLLHINPGAAGNFGVHLVRTAVCCQVAGRRILDLKVLEIPRE
ncbi:MAG: metallophosphatase family protein [Bacteroidetes bacterium]|nr:metallophosphatase family protein [Bacteroidota bacterium]